MCAGEGLGISSGPFHMDFTYSCIYLGLLKLNTLRDWALRTYVIQFAVANGHIEGLYTHLSLSEIPRSINVTPISIDLARKHSRP
jgi:hypothetical protein